MALERDAATLPWLRAPWLLAAITVLCLPYLLVTVPPLIDFPGTSAPRQSRRPRRAVRSTVTGTGSGPTRSTWVARC